MAERGDGKVADSRREGFRIGHDGRAVLEQEGADDPGVFFDFEVGRRAALGKAERVMGEEPSPDVELACHDCERRIHLFVTVDSANPFNSSGHFGENGILLVSGARAKLRITPSPKSSAEAGVGGGIVEEEQGGGSGHVQGAGGITVTSVWKPGDREGKFLDYNFDIDVYSMQYQSPKSKLQSLNELVTGVYVPMVPMLMQQGGMIDMFALTEKYADLMNLPELMDIVKFAGVVSDTESDVPMAEVPKKSPMSTRNYVRHNVSAGQQNPMQQAVSMMGQAGQQQGPQTPGGMT